MNGLVAEGGGRGASDRQTRHFNLKLKLVCLREAEEREPGNEVEKNFCHYSCHLVRLVLPFNTDIKQFYKKKPTGKNYILRNYIRDQRGIFSTYSLVRIFHDVRQCALFTVVCADIQFFYLYITKRNLDSALKLRILFSRFKNKHLAHIVYSSVRKILLLALENKIHIFALPWTDTFYLIVYFFCNSKIPQGKCICWVLQFSFQD